jgi:ATP-dependent Clp protease ATP-binding subunit ClpA
MRTAANYGAHMKRVIQNRLQNSLAQTILSSEFPMKVHSIRVDTLKTT